MAGRRRALALVLAGLALLSAVSSASAHPLGNFTVNRYSRIELQPTGVRIRYVLDFAEVPSVQERQVAGSDWDGYRLRRVDEVRRNLELTVDGAAVELHTEGSALSTPPGQGDIPLVRIEAWFHTAGPWPTDSAIHQASFRDRNDPTRIGWREIVVRAESGVVVSQSTVPANDATDELRRYPETMLQDPLNTRDARWSFERGASGQSAQPRSTGTGAARPVDAFTALITTADLSPSVFLLALLAAASLGGMHAASPGHGKTVMAAYIVGTRGTLLHAVALALSVTVSHTFGVLALGVLTLLASNLILPEQLYPWLTLIAALIVVVLGLWLVTSALRGRDHHPEHDHDHEHRHVHPPAARLPLTWRSLFALGLAGGIVPSASALVVLLSAVALGRLGFGLLLILAFGVGMAVVLTATGVLLVYASRFMARVFPEHARSPRQRAFARAVPLVSAGIMLLVGVVATVQALAQFGVVSF